MRPCSCCMRPLCSLPLSPLAQPCPPPFSPSCVAVAPTNEAFAKWIARLGREVDVEAPEVLRAVLVSV